MMLKGEAGFIFFNSFSINLTYFASKSIHLNKRFLYEIQFIMFSSWTYLQPLVIFLSAHMIHASRFNTGNIVNIRVDYSIVPYQLPPIPQESDEAPTDPLRPVGLSESNIAFRTVTLRLENTTRDFNGRQITYLEGETIFEPVLAVVRTEYLYEQPGVVCELLEPDLDNFRSAEVMRSTEQYPYTIPNDYLPWYKWAKGIRCFQLPPDSAS